MLEFLHGWALNEEEYGQFSKVLRRMLHPDLQSRATIEEVLAADIFQ